MPSAALVDVRQSFRLVPTFQLARVGTSLPVIIRNSVVFHAVGADDADDAVARQVKGVVP